METGDYFPDPDQIQRTGSSTTSVTEGVVCVTQNRSDRTKTTLGDEIIRHVYVGA